MIVPPAPGYGQKFCAKVGKVDEMKTHHHQREKKEKKFKLCNNSDMSPSITTKTRSLNQVGELILKPNIESKQST